MHQQILLVSSEFPPGPGGIGRHAEDLSLALAGKGCHVDVWSSIDYVDGEAVDIYKSGLPDNITLHQFRRIGLLTYPARILKVFKAIRKIKYDLLVFTGKFSLWIGGLIKTFYGNRKTIDFFVHGSEVNPGNSFTRMITHWALDKADRIWAVSEFTRSILPERIRMKKEIHILPNGIYAKKWPTPSEVIPLKDWKGNPKLLTVGSISPRKGQHRVINALSTLMLTYPDIHYHIIGIDKNASHLRDLIKTLNLEEHITIHGRLPGIMELARAYKTADIFIMLSDNQPDGDVEGFGIAILEANLYGLPAIGAKGCGIEDAIVSGINGELVDGNNPEEIKSAVQKILEQKEYYLQRMKDWVICHEWNMIINDFLELK
ncbi:MAG: glycosyltransferase family 4 protein [Spirochaetes bacterium]|nr:glycosyltransferase family 4 protein [Spirochaetota bacterium]